MYIELWDARGQFGELERSNYSLLSALQTFQVHHIAEEIAFLLINCKILVTRGTVKQTLLLAGYKSSLKENSFFKTDSENVLIYSLLINWNEAETKVKES